MPHTSLPQSGSAQGADTCTAERAFPIKLFLLIISSNKSSLKSFAFFYFSIFSVCSFRSSSFSHYRGVASIHCPLTAATFSQFDLKLISH